MKAAVDLELPRARSRAQEALFAEYDAHHLEARGVDRIEWLAITDAVMDAVHG